MSSSLEEAMEELGEAESEAVVQTSEEIVVAAIDTAAGGCEAGSEAALLGRAGQGRGRGRGRSRSRVSRRGREGVELCQGLARGWPEAGLRLA